MAKYYSDHYVEDNDSNATFDRTQRKKVSAGIKDGAIRYARASVKGQFSIGDFLSMLRLPSNARIIELYVSSDDADGSPTAGTAHVGVYRETIDGSIAETIDSDILGVSANIHNQTRTDAYAGGALEQADRGKPLWQVASEVSGTYTEDPGIELAIYMLVNANMDAHGEVVLEVFYTLDN